ncbi:MAG: MarC family protein [Kiloniellaceae bacterium]
MTETLIAAFVTFFVVVDPVGVAPLFVSLTPGATTAERRRTALRGATIGGAVLVAFALVGEPFLRALGIGLPAFRIAGGVLLLLLAIDMVMARQTGLRATTPGEDEESGQRADVSVFPLAIPLIAGPGALTSVVLLMGGARGDLAAQGVILAVLVVVLLITLACLLAAAQLMRLLGTTGVNVVTRVFGIVTAALAVQFMIDGALAVWPTVR